MLEMERTWNCATASFSREKADKWWSEILKHYNEEHRHYHNLNNIQEKFRHFEDIKLILKDPNAVALALFFHYTVKEIPFDFLKKIFIQDFSVKDSPLRREVLNLLEAATIHSTEAHKIGGTYGNADCHYFLDIDVAILGTDPESYADYTKLIRKEYDFLSDSTYKSLRLKVLQSFLMIPNIFATKEFREKFEAQAKENIEKEVQTLKS